MDSFLIVFLGIATVIAGTMLIRLHPFIALFAGSFLIAQLTSREMLETSVLHDKWTKVEIKKNLPDANDPHAVLLHSMRHHAGQIDENEIKFSGNYSRSGEYYLSKDKKLSSNMMRIYLKIKSPWILQGSFAGDIPYAPPAPDEYYFYKEMKDHDERVYSPLTPENGTFYIIRQDNAHTYYDMAYEKPINRIINGLCKTFTEISLMIAMASILGQCMLISGSATKIVHTIRSLVGERFTSISFVICSFALAVTINFYIIFFLMLPLAKAMAQQTKKDYLKYVISIVVGGTLAQSFLLTNPDPKHIAYSLHVDNETMFMLGCIVSLLGICSGYCYLYFINRYITLPLPELHDKPAVHDKLYQHYLPPFWLAILPILFPVIAISMEVLWQFIQTEYYDFIPIKFMILLGDIGFSEHVNYWGDIHVSLAMAAILGMLIAFFYAPLSKQDLLKKIQAALADGGLIILMICAAGAFGEMIRHTDIAYRLSQMSPTSGSGMFILLMAFMVTGVIRVTHGSASVSMLTSAGIFAPLATTGSLPFDIVYIALAIGCGSQLVPWMNDSSFWLVGRMSGMTEVQTFKTFSILSTIMGIAGFFATLVLATLFPLI